MTRAIVQDSSNSGDEFVYGLLAALLFAFTALVSYLLETLRPDGFASKAAMMQFLLQALAVALLFAPYLGLFGHPKITQYAQNPELFAPWAGITRIAYAMLVAALIILVAITIQSLRKPRG